MAGEGERVNANDATNVVVVDRVVTSRTAAFDWLVGVCWFVLVWRCVIFDYLRRGIAV